MARFLVDSPILIRVLEGDTRSTKLLSGLLERDHSLALSPITAAEIYAACGRGNLRQTEALLARLELHSPDLRVAQAAGQLVQRSAGLRKRGPDGAALLAATALVHGCRLLSERPRRYPFPGLTLTTGEEST